MASPLIGCLLAAGLLIWQVGQARPGPLRAPGAWFGADLDWVLLAAWLLCALAAAWRLRRSPTLPLAVLLMAVALRAAALALPPVLSDDVYRYLWEGKVQLAGHNPFALAPADPSLSALRDAVWAQVNHKEVSTIYPPGALLLFRAVSATLYAPLAWKLLASLADLGVLLGLTVLTQRRGVAAWAAALYALHPLPVLESAGSGHLESLALLGLTLSLVAAERGRPSAAALLASLGALIKLLPVALLWPLLRRFRARLLPGLALSIGLTAILTLPFVEAGGALGRGFGTYYEAWSFNSAFFPALAALAGGPGPGRALGVALGAAWCALSAWRREEPAAFFLDVAAALLLLSPVVHPWYALWALVPALALGRWPWAVLASTTLLSYVVLRGYDRFTGVGWEEPWWLSQLVYGPLLLSLLASAIWTRRSRPSTPAPAASP